MNMIQSTLNKMIGTYMGEGINHEGQAFVGRLELQSLLDGRGFQLKFSATGADGTIYHKEDSIIASSIQEKLTLWNLNTNLPGLIPHELKRSESKVGGVLSLTFGYNNIDDKNKFREEVTFDIWSDLSLSYSYSWGLPGDNFQERSGVRMRKVDSMKLDYVMTMVEDMSRSIEFYRDIIGLSLIFSSESWTEFHAGATTLALHSGGKSKNPSGSTNEPHNSIAGTASLGFNVKDVKSVFDDLRSKGVSFLLEPTIRKEEGIVLAIAVDPDGLEISFTQKN